MSLSIIIPCKNEEENIENTIKEIITNIREYISEFEIILINDFSSDETLNIIKVIKGKYPNINVYDNKRAGLGGAINLGIKNSAKDYTVIVMADLSDSPSDIIRYYKEIKAKKLDAVLGTRFSSNSKIIDYPTNKLVLNRIFNNLVKILFWVNYNDFTNAFKIYNTNTLKELKPIVSENFNIFLELPLKIIVRKYKYSIISINWRNRKMGKAKFKLKELGSKYLFTLLYCFFEKILLR